ncbi:hypothetical protein [Aliamphritea hakodatensis]|uniref:hypothetical protein n=1 Tax=Aliamphritea hakodatensis TaxID=2895352 RepID=UPI0022FDA634|nr:hypothetical protein [Aliamphritea hakodatensis]
MNLTRLIKATFAASTLFMMLTAPAHAFTKTIGKGFCTLRHPVEALTSSRMTTCESQHIIQQQSGGGSNGNTIWINTLEHDYLDRSVDKPWAKERPWFNWGDKNLERAYMMGVYANGYHFVTYKHHGNGNFTLFTWDGASHATYAIASIANFITKEMSYIGYQIERDDNEQSTQYIDAFLGVVIDLFEVVIGVCYSMVGIVVGTLFNPIDTVTNIPGAVVLSAEAVVEGVANTVSDIVSAVTLGYVQL